jgi:hypothetical protein
MGYTHYWYQHKDFTTEQWSNIQKDVLDIIVKYCDKNHVALTEEYDSPMLVCGPTPPIASKAMIRFNGWREEGHETFMLEKKMPMPRIPGRNYHFNFCKTARKPYDIAVCLVLLICATHAPDVLSISSDGSWEEDWTEARKVYKQLFNRETDCIFQTEEIA